MFVNWFAIMQSLSIWTCIEMLSSILRFKTLDVIIICCQHVLFQMLHKNCPMHFLWFLHMLHDATKNQEHLGKLFHEPI
jgi:hypothetical protein